MPFLVTPPLPKLKVEIAFDSGFATAEGARTWTDVSVYVEGASSVDITYGRADELSTPDPNTCSLTLDNRDGRFTPGKASSPYFPNVKKGKPLRVTVTYAGVDYVRFMGYVNEWPLVWPDGSSAASTVTITAASRRARLGQTAPLTSAIRAAYLADSPVSYWPMTDNILTSDGRYVFRDVTNPVFNERATGSIGAFAATTALAIQPVIDDGTPGPTDEGSLVKLPATTDPVNSDGVHNISGSNVTSFGSNLSPLTGGCSFEMVARALPTSGGAANVVLGQMFAGPDNFSSEVGFGLFDNGTDQWIRPWMVLRDQDGTTLETSSWFFISTLDALSSAYGRATDGEIHHYYLEIYAQAIVLYFDGEVVSYATLTGSLTLPFRSVALGSRTLFTNLWVGHVAVYDRSLSLSGGGPGLHNAAATAASETPEERVVRIAGRIGVPATEVDVEDTIAGPMGPQPEAGRSAAEVLDELAVSTGSVLYDGRAGHLVMQARNHRYNLPVAFTLSAVRQEIEGDLTVTDDHRYTINTVEYSRSGSDDGSFTITDQGSVDAYGVFSQSYTVVSEFDTEAEAFAQNILARYADPDPRVSTVSVDVVNLGTSQRDAVLTADIGTRFGLQDLASQAPTDPMHVFYEGATESITHASHTLTMNTTPADIGQNVFILDDPTYGVLDQNVLAY